MKFIKSLIIIFPMILLISCSSPKVNNEKPISGKTETIIEASDNSVTTKTESQGEREASFTTNNETLKEVKINIEKAHEIGANNNSPDADPYIDNAIEGIKKYLSEGNESNTDIDFIDSISGISVIQNTDYILVGYDKCYDKYGGGISGNYTSWKVIKYKPYNLVEIIEKNSPLLLSHECRIVNIDGQTMLYMYGLGMWEKTQTLHISAYKIDKNAVVKSKPIRFKDIEDNSFWQCYEEGRVTTKTHENLMFEFISDDAKELRISTVNSKYNEVLKLTLNKEGQYNY